MARTNPVTGIRDVGKLDSKVVLKVRTGRKPETIRSVRFLSIALRRPIQDEGDPPTGRPKESDAAFAQRIKDYRDALQRLDPAALIRVDEEIAARAALGQTQADSKGTSASQTPLVTASTSTSTPGGRDDTNSTESATDCVDRHCVVCQYAFALTNNHVNDNADPPRGCSDHGHTDSACNHPTFDTFDNNLADSDTSISNASRKTSVGSGVTGSIKATTYRPLIPRCLTSQGRSTGADIRASHAADSVFSTTRALYPTRRSEEEVTATRQYL